MNFCNIKRTCSPIVLKPAGHPLGLDRVFGFALIRAWVYLMFVGAAASFMTWSGEADPDQRSYVVSAGALCAALFGSALSRRALRATHDCIRQPRASPAPALTGVGHCPSRLVGVPRAPEQATVCGIIGRDNHGPRLRDSSIWATASCTATNHQAAPPSKCPWPSFSPLLPIPSPSMLPPVTSCVRLRAFARDLWMDSVRASSTPGRASARPTVRPIEFDLKSFAWRIGLCACLVGIADGMVRAAFLSSNNLSIRVLLQWPLAGAGLHHHAHRLRRRPVGL